MPVFTVHLFVLCLVESLYTLEYHTEFLKTIQCLLKYYVNLPSVMKSLLLVPNPSSSGYQVLILYYLFETSHFGFLI